MGSIGRVVGDVWGGVKASIDDTRQTLALSFDTEAVAKRGLPPQGPASEAVSAEPPSKSRIGHGGFPAWIIKGYPR